ncbi:ABC transporter permease [Sediminispirochaeta bajacaliforniensis]|uniref:ABC transporter permease n=1 Tax=Sediminispirochaeta bajacaliforniensis TaxID=148 RepID=UPI000382D5FA|nr:ABC transporter permease [Sediminispirochaeta bajacaliforniensis]
MKRKELRVLTIIMVLSFVFMTVLNPRDFLRAGNFQGMAFQLPELGVLSLAMMIVMLTGGINLSIIATADLAGIVAAMILTIPKFGGVQAPGWLVMVALLGAIAAALLVGLLNGVLIAYIGVAPILTTLGTMTLVNGITIVLTKGYVISGFPPAVRFIGNGMLLGIPFPLLLFGMLAVIMAIFLNRTPTGFNIYMYGSNDVATHFYGGNNAGIILRTYLVSGLLSGFAALIMISRFNSAKAGYGASYLLVTILAAVLGGVSSEGGFGRVSGLILSLVTLQIISSGLNLLRVSSFMTIAIWGFVMILVMVVNYYSDKRRERLLRTQG